MNVFLNLTTRTKLFFGFGLILFLLLVVIAAIYRSTAVMQASQELFYNLDFADTVKLMKIRSTDNLIHVDILAKSSEQKKWHNDLKKKSGKIDNLFQQLLERPCEDQTFLDKLNEMKAARDAYVKTRDDQLIPLIYAGKIKDAMDRLGIQSERYRRCEFLSWN